MHLKIKNIFVFCLANFLVMSCDTNTVFSDHKTYPKKWHKDSLAIFEFTPKDTINPYHIFINLRTEKQYQFNNLFLIVALEYPNGKVQKDTLEYAMADKNGKLYGEGWAVKAHKLWYKGYNSPFVFEENGTYQINIGHAMRKNGAVKGIVELEAVTDVGISIEEKAEDKSNNIKR